MMTASYSLAFRGMQGEQDYPLLVEINLSSRAADHDPHGLTVEDMQQTFAGLDDFSPARNIRVAITGEPPAAIGYSRLGWYASAKDNRNYFQISFLRQEYRASGVWPLMIRDNERCLREIAAGHPQVPQAYLLAWASDTQPDWSAALESCGYQAVQRFNNMLFALDEIQIAPLPAGLEVRPVLPEHMHEIWMAQKEMNAGLFENVEEDWLEEKYPAWLAEQQSGGHYWQAAWDGDQLAGITLAQIDENENQELNLQRGLTEHVFVRPPWRKRGLAAALITHAHQILKEHGMKETELGVDTQNESAAYALYQRLGYKTFSVDTWYRKPLEENELAI